MESFKKVLKYSIEQNVDYLWLVEDELAVSGVEKVETELDIFPAISSAEIRDVLQALLPDAINLSSGDTKSGFFPVVGLGDLKISASCGRKINIGLIINTNDSAVDDLVLQKHKQNTFVSGGLDVPPIPDVGSLDISSNEIEHNFDIKRGTEASPSGFAIDVPDIKSADLSQESVELDNQNPDLSLDISSNIFNEAISEAEQYTVNEDTDSPVLGEESLSLDIPSENLNFNEEPLTSVGDVSAPASNPNTGSYSASGNMFPSSPELQYTNAYGKPELADDTSSDLEFGPSMPGDRASGASTAEIDELLRLMINKNASDIHLTQGEKVCLRIDGDIERIDGEVLDSTRMKELILPILPTKNGLELRETNDTDFSYAIEGVARFRVNVFRDLRGIGSVIRQIPNEVLTVEQLGLPESIVNLCKLGKGLVVVTGPTGSGKSTTLAAMVDYINKTRKKHILTIEDPVEFVHTPHMSLINQREVYKHTQSFSRALKAALREDPDIVLIGEMRDLETVAIAIETAETGHLVFGTLHTNTAISTIDRLIDQFPSDGQEQIRVMLAESLKGVVAQTLLKKKGGGRVAAHEILIADKAVGAQIREKNTHMLTSHMQTQKRQGNILLNDSLAKLVEDNIVTPEEAYAKAVDKEGFISMMKMKKIEIEQI